MVDFSIRTRKWLRSLARINFAALVCPSSLENICLILNEKYFVYMLKNYIKIFPNLKYNYTIYIIPSLPFFYLYNFQNVIHLIRQTYKQKIFSLLTILLNNKLKKNFYKYQHTTEGRVGNRLLLQTSLRGLVNLHKNFPFSQGYIQCYTYVHIYQTIQNEGQSSNQNIESADKPLLLLLWIVHTQILLKK